MSRAPNLSNQFISDATVNRFPSQSTRPSFCFIMMSMTAYLLRRNVSCQSGHRGCMAERAGIYRNVRMMPSGL